MKKQLLLKKNEEKRLLNGHLWVFSNEVKELRGDAVAGDVIELRDHAGKFLGKGFFNPNSLIAFRLLTREEEEIDARFFELRIAEALKLRTRLFPRSNTYRLVHGEGDFLPGLVIDRYENFLSLQSFSVGMDLRLPKICDALESLLQPKGIVERNESPLRALEGLPEEKEILRGIVEPVIVSDGAVSYEVDLLEGQKTGLYLDQRDNRFLIERFAKNARVLDCFCNDGGFSLHAAKGGAKDVRGLDISSAATSRASRNTVINSLNSSCSFSTGNVFDSLTALVESKKQYDMVILDPPSFTKSKKTLATARQGYKQINTHAIQLLADGGILATASCSHHVSREMFAEIISESARRAGRRIQLLEWRGAGPDHPVIAAMPETEYLKFGLFQVT